MSKSRGYNFKFTVSVTQTIGVMFRIFRRRFCTFSAAKYSCELQAKFTDKHVTGTTKEILIRGEFGEGEKKASFAGPSTVHFCGGHPYRMGTDETILPYGIPDIPSFTPSTSDLNGFGLSMWNSSAVSSRFNSKWISNK